MRCIKIYNYSIIVIAAACAFLNNAYGRTQEIEHKIRTEYEQFVTYAERHNDSTAFFLKQFKNSLHHYLVENNSKTVPVIKALGKQFGGLWISESKDKKLIIISWDDRTGGTMRNFDGIYCYERGDRYVTENIYKDTEEFVINANNYEVHQVVNRKGTSIYILFAYEKASSALFGYTIRTVTIENGELNTEAKYIRTAAGLTTRIDYVIDWTDSANRDNPIERYFQVPSFEQATQMISIPLIWEDGKLTTKRIKYRFNGEFFEKRSK